MKLHMFIEVGLLYPFRHVALSIRNRVSEHVLTCVLFAEALSSVRPSRCVSASAERGGLAQSSAGCAMVVICACERRPFEQASQKIADVMFQMQDHRLPGAWVPGISSPLRRRSVCSADPKNDKKRSRTSEKPSRHCRTHPCTPKPREKESRDLPADEAA